MNKENKASEGYLKSTVIYAIGDIIPKILAFISFPILTSYLSTEDYGIVNYINSISMFLIVFNILNLNTFYIIHYFKCETVKDQKQLLGNLTIFISLFNLAILAFFIIAGYIFDQNFNAKIAFFPYIFLGVLANFFNVFSILPLASFRVKKQPLMFAGMSISKNVLQLLITVLLVIVYKMLALGVLYSILIAAIVFFFYYVYYTLNNADFIFNYQQIKSALLFSLPLVPGTLAYLLINLLDRVIIARYLSLSDLGIYGTAATLGLLINIVSTGFYQALEPLIFKKYSESGFKQEFIRIRKMMLVVLLVTAMGIALYSQEFLFFMSAPSFHHAYIYLPILLLGGIMAGINMLYSTLITASGHTKTNSLNIIIGCVVSIPLNFLLVPHIGVMGAAIAFMLAFGIILGLSVYKSNFRFLSFKELLAILLWICVVALSVYYYHFKPGLSSIIIKMLIIFGFSGILILLTGIRKFRKTF
ncbi:oligosaccharide flippase family protein [Chitinophaga arvensicola]|uniref:Membrane protein involved in the export of O-antigen and teichoic acid n=1 Tax=Chitinophaga arvensicola TaxID=29529 RepID=A0A1I0NQ13_9BACT|nr:oligosaccharide flippase family protein [Chitinophaga arvensicola]SEW03313.1 Membrane protein involved in the export of O-antigen and teichoic acid [Chitinophaga arvensicola]